MSLHGRGWSSADKVWRVDCLTKGGSMSDGFTNSDRAQALFRPKDVLYAIESEAISIRKSLCCMKRPRGRKAWRDMDDAVRLARAIEKIAHRDIVKCCG